MAYKPFPSGTVRGPLRDCHGVVFMVNTATGWVPFRGKLHEVEETRERADKFAKETLEKEGA